MTCSDSDENDACDHCVNVTHTASTVGATQARSMHVTQTSQMQSGHTHLHAIDNILQLSRCGLLTGEHTLLVRCNDMLAFARRVMATGMQQS